jgi:hypothetical protein
MIVVTIEQAVLNIKKRAEKMVRGTVIGCASRIIKRTPVGNPDLWAGDAPVGYTGGTLRGNWQPSIGQPINTTITRTDAGGSAVTADISREGERLNIGAVFYMSNNLPYAGRIEFDGWSKQASQGMMRIEVLETAAAIRANRIKD